MPKVLQVVIYTSVSDEAKLADYAVLAGPAMMAKGARFLARGLPIAVREAGQKTRTVVIEFPSYQAALDCYNDPEYQKAKAKRDLVATGNFVIVEGYDG